jgi:hypothetical protein
MLPITALNIYNKMTKLRKLKKPRAAQLNTLLLAKKGGKHEPKTGEHAKRARQKRNARKEVNKQLTDS